MVKGKELVAKIVDVQRANIIGRDPNITYHGDTVVCEVLAARQHPKGYALVNPCFPHRIGINFDLCSIDEGTAKFLEGLVMALRPTICLETGTHLGRSTKAIAQGLAENGSGHLWTVDMDDYGTLPMALQGIESYVSQVVGKTPGILSEEPLNKLQNIDFAFLDGDHTGEGLKAELEFVDARRASSCWVVIDNATDPGWPEVRDVLNAYNKYPRLTLATMCGTELIWMHD